MQQRENKRWNQYLDTYVGVANLVGICFASFIGTILGFPFSIFLLISAPLSFLFVTHYINIKNRSSRCINCKSGIFSKIVDIGKSSKLGSCIDGKKFFRIYFFFNFNVELSLWLLQQKRAGEDTYLDFLSFLWETHWNRSLL